MKKRPFREHHLLNFFEGYEIKPQALDFALHLYFKGNKALGSKDRAWIAKNVYGIVRWQGLIDYFLDEPINYEKRLETFIDLDPLKFKNREDIPEHIRVSFPKILFDQIKKSHGKKAEEICYALNSAAPTTIRVNALKTTREKILESWEKKYEVSPCKKAPNGIIFNKRINFFELPEFKQGFFEVQDEASQLVADMIDAKPNDSILDYCAGSGGKTLAFAPKLNNSGQIYLYDIRPRILQEAKKRLKRAGVQNAQIIKPNDPKLKKLKKKMDWVLVDAPCTGSGTYRRNPDMKWKFDEQMLKELVGKQRNIFEKALSFLKPGGHIVYATCSILKEENQTQVEHFLKTYDLQLVGTPFQSTPMIDGMDGFFAAVFSLTVI